MWALHRSLPLGHWISRLKDRNAAHRVHAAMVLASCSDHNRSATSPSGERQVGSLVPGSTPPGPQSLTIQVNTTVTWINRDDIPHTVVSTDSVFKSKVLDTDEEYSYTFTKSGTFPYFCSIHPKMTGKVVVQ